jgi:hypothetical protein
MFHTAFVFICISGNINYVSTKTENVECYVQAMGAEYGAPFFFFFLQLTHQCQHRLNDLGTIKHIINVNPLLSGQMFQFKPQLQERVNPCL